MGSAAQASIRPSTARVTDAQGGRACALMNNRRRRAQASRRATEKFYMTKKTLIDASHAEETRVVVIDGSRVDDFDFESQNRKQLRGNIYLAKVTRVEPSLQAAFIEYGGNRHGFLAFNEIHPDYYQIPLADREALMREEAEEDDEPIENSRPFEFRRWRRRR